MKIDPDDIWLWYHHLENASKLNMNRGEYCSRYGLDPKRYGNVRYNMRYCKEANPKRYAKMMEFCEEFDKVKGTIPMGQFCKSHRIKKDDLYVAIRHREYTWIILDRIAKNHPVPELKEVEKPVPEVERPPAVEEPQTLDEPTVFETFDNLATDSPVETPVFVDEPPKADDIIAPKEVIEKWREMREKPKLTLSDFISKAKLAEEVPEVHFDEAEEFERLSREYDEPSYEETPIPAKRGRKSKVLDSEDIPEEKEPMKFFTLQTPAPLTMHAEGLPSITEELKPEPLPEVIVKGNLIELTFTKTVRFTAAPDTPHDKLLDIINLLKDL